MAGTLYVVATPLGNLEDMTLRAVRILKEVALIAAEDTRHSRTLLAHFGIERPLTSYFDHVERERAPKLVERLRRGEDIALISDAGTPGIADPGYRLVRAAIDAGIRVVPIPGPSVVTAGLSVAGVPTDRFAFEGFVPAKATARRHFYEAVAREDRTVVCFESGRRLVESLADLAAAMPDRQVVIGREVTKLYEDFVRGPAAELAARAGDLVARGEVTLFIAPPAGETPTMTAEALRAEIARRRAAGLHLKEIARALAAESGWHARDVYRLGLERDGDD
ncbi:16S rRNA (cytidine(1402)-2'-O)-methyltransferase [bacterium]|nr:16S rRNA (cytidine(1402)-2'-O)-methyltransferase [bacterium]